MGKFRFSEDIVIIGNIGIGKPDPETEVDVAGDISCTGQLISTAADGIPPLAVESIDKVDKLNADMLDGYHLNDIIPAGTIIALHPNVPEPNSEIWTLCNGGQYPESSHESLAGTEKPDLTDDRFLMGGTSPGIGGSNDAMAHTHDFTQPNAHGLTQPEFTVPNHKHPVAEIQSTGSGTAVYVYNSNGSKTGMLWQPANNWLQGGANWSAVHFSSSSNDIYYTSDSGEAPCNRSTDITLTNNHTGGSVNEVVQSRTNRNIPKYFKVKYYIKYK